MCVHKLFKEKEGKKKAEAFGTMAKRTMVTCTHVKY